MGNGIQMRILTTEVSTSGLNFPCNLLCIGYGLRALMQMQGGLKGPIWAWKVVDLRERETDDFRCWPKGSLANHRREMLQRDFQFI